jgi:dTDP-glucose 4,6-dehydratase
VRRRRAVVTGGAGFLGSHLIERLLADGFEVLCLDNFLTGVRDNVEHLAARDGFTLLDVDVTRDMQVGGPVDAVLHLASPASPVDYLRFPVQTLHAGSLGTFNALELARVKRARFVLASTSETYGDPQVHPQPESYWGHVNPVGPRAVYDEAKRFAEAATTAYRSTHGVNTAIVRIFNTFGPRMRACDGRAVPTFIRQALAGEPLTVAGDGSQTRSVCYVDDLVDGVVRMLHSDQPGPINIGNPHELTMLELAETVRRLAHSSSPISFVPRPVDDPLRWEPRVTLEDGLMRTIAWFRSHSVTVPGLAAEGRPVIAPARGPASV